MGKYKGLIVTIIIVAAPLVWLILRLSAIKAEDEINYTDIENSINQISEQYISDSKQSGDTDTDEKASGEKTGSKYGTPISKIIENAKINVASANVYAEPDETSGVIGSAYKDIPIAVQDYPNGWSMIRIDELSGWVKTEYITKPDEASSTSEVLGTVIGKRAKVKVTNLRVRSSASSASDNIIDSLKDGDEVKIIGANDDESWLQVQYGTKSGWISGNTNYVTILD
jgi:uncharacterized protein YgiM (DUF1202 family)